MKLQPLTDTDLQKVWIRSALYIRKEQRSGQAFFNALRDFYPDYASEVSGSSSDPFYQDRNLTNCINYITGLTHLVK